MSKPEKRAHLRVNSNLPTALIILLEIFAIVVGVMLGFAVNEWRLKEISDHQTQGMSVTSY